MPQVHVALIKQSSEELKETRQDVARRCTGACALKGEVCRLLQDELLKKEEEEAKLSLRSHLSRLSGELEELRTQPRAAGSCWLRLAFSGRNVCFSERRREAHTCAAQQVVQNTAHGII